MPSLQRYITEIGFWGQNVADLEFTTFLFCKLMGFVYKPWMSDIST